MDDDKEKLRNVRILEFHLVNSKRNIILGFLFSSIIGFLFSEHLFKLEVVLLLGFCAIFSWFYFEKELKAIIESVRGL